MAKRTLYGIIEGPIGASETVTFRLHLSAEVDMVALGLADAVLTEHSYLTGPLALYVRNHPSPGVIYERELYVCREHHRKGYPILHLKEGPRFTEASYDGQFRFFLCDFLIAQSPKLKAVRDAQF